MGTAGPAIGAIGKPAVVACRSKYHDWEAATPYFDGCLPIEVPENALATGSSYGRGWECRRGYREVNETCIVIKIPENAYLNASGVRWECNRGFREFDKACVAINVPENGYLTESDFGSGWKCERGFQAKGEMCIPVELPANAHIDFSGSDWDCDRPYEKHKGGCVLR